MKVVYLLENGILYYTGYATDGKNYIQDPTPQMSNIPSGVPLNSLQGVPYLNFMEVITQEQLSKIQNSKIQKNMMLDNQSPALGLSHITGGQGAVTVYRTETPGNTKTVLTYALTVRNPTADEKKFLLGGTSKLVSQLFSFTAAMSAGLEYLGTYGTGTYDIIQDNLDRESMRITAWQEQTFNATTGADASDAYAANALQNGSAVIGQLNGNLQPIVYPKSSSDFQLSIKNFTGQEIQKILDRDNFLLRTLPPNRSTQIIFTIESVEKAKGLVLPANL